MSEKEIRSVMVPLGKGHLLIPNASIAEVVAFSPPDPVSDAPVWLLGTFQWHGWQVPVIGFSTLVDDEPEIPGNDARLCVTKTLIENQRMPYIAILAQGYPRLTTITEDNLSEEPLETKPIAVAGRVRIDDIEAYVPDLDRLGHLVAHAAFGALPLTS